MDLKTLIEKEIKGIQSLSRMKLGQGRKLSAFCILPHSIKLQRMMWLSRKMNAGFFFRPTVFFLEGDNLIGNILIEDFFYPLNAGM